MKYVSLYTEIQVGGQHIPSNSDMTATLLNMYSMTMNTKLE